MTLSDGHRVPLRLVAAVAFPAALVFGALPARIRVGNTVLKQPTGGRGVLSYDHRDVADAFFVEVQEKDGAWCPLLGPEAAEAGVRLRDLANGRALEFPLPRPGAPPGDPTRFALEIRSHSCRLVCERPVSGTARSTVRWGFLLRDAACVGATFTARFADGTEKHGELERDPLFADPTLPGVQRLDLESESAPRLRVSCDLPGGFRFSDERRQSRNWKRRVSVTLAGDREQGALSLSFGDSADVSFAHVDLRTVCNLGFADVRSNDGQGGWLDCGEKNDLRMFPLGRRFFAGVPFDIIDPTTNGGRATVVLKGSPRHGESFPASASIPVGGTGATLHVLNATGYADPTKDDGKVVGAYVFVYADGTEEEHETVYGRDIMDWWNMAEKANYVRAWDGTNPQARISIGLSSFAIGRPGVPVATLRAEKRGDSGTLIGLIAATVSDVPLRLTPEKPILGPPALEPLSFRCAAGGGILASWIDPKKLNVEGVTVASGYDAVAGRDDLLVVGATLEGYTKGGPNPEEAQAIADYVRQGGALLIAWPLSPNIDGLGELLPVEKREGSDPIVLMPKEEALTVVPVDADHPVFAGMDLRDFQAQPYYYAVRVKPGGEVLASFSNGEPALVASRHGRGRVLYQALPFTYGYYLGYTHRHPWRRTTYFLKMLYWLAGKEEYAVFLGELPRADRLRESLSDVLSGCRTSLQNVRALAGYLGATESADVLRTEVLELDSAMDTADRYRAALRLRQAAAQYADLLESARALLARVRNAMSALREAADRKAGFALIDVRAGPPVDIGPHGVGVAYCSERSSDNGVRERAFRRQLSRQKELLGFTASASHTALAYFVKRRADPASVDDEDLNLWIYDDLLRVCRDIDWRHFVAVDSGDGRAWTGGCYEYFNKGVPLRAKPGKVYGDHGRRVYQPNIWDRMWRTRRTQVLERVAAYYRDKPEVIGYDLDNEPSAGLGHSADAIQHFRRWLKAKFGSVEALNEALRTQYASLDDIVPATTEEVRKAGLGPSGGRAVWYEWWLFQDDVLVQHVREDYEAIKRVSPAKIVRDRFSDISVTGRSSHGFVARRHPYHRITKYLDMTGLHTWVLYPLDFMRAQANNAAVGFSEYYVLALDGPYDFRLRLHGGAGDVWTVPVVESENVNFAAAQRNLWVAASRGVRSFSIHSPSGGTGVYNMAQPTQVHWRRKLYALKYATAEFARIRGELDGATAISQVALFEPPATVVQSPGSTIEADVYNTEIEQKAIFNALHEPLGVQSDPVAPGADLSRYRVLVFSQPLFMADATEEWAMAFVHEGGVLVATGPIGLYDEHAFPRQSRLRQRIGLLKADRMPFAGDIRFSGGLAVAPASDKASVWRYTFAATAEAEVMARFDDGAPAVVQRRIGQGRVILTAYGLTQTKDIPGQLSLFVLPYLSPPAETTRPVHLFFLEKDGDTIIYAYNRAVAPVTATMEFAQGCTVDDLRAGVRFSTASVGLDLGAGEARVFRCSATASPVR